MAERRRLVILNALPLNSIPLTHFCVDVKRIDTDFLRHLAKEAKSINAEIANYIRHEATVKLLNQLLNLSLEPSSGLYQWREGDRIVVITLKKPIRGQEVSEVKPEDLDIFHVYVSEVCY
ncbi:MAG: hypothetical protein C0179_08080 [Fervidicoccus sp.]|nr:MAG: hypothetical protein C0179_08080 [Fervidicoccus sp.]